MEFFALIPIWIAVSACYLSSSRQKVVSAPINKQAAYSIATCLTVLAVLVISVDYPFLSAALACLVIVMCFLPIVAIVGAYGEKRFTQVTGFILLFSISFAALNGGVPG